MFEVNVDRPAIDWGLNQSQEQSLNAQAGVKSIVDQVNESVKRKVEEDRQFDAQMIDLAKNAHGRFQDEILTNLTNYRDQLKKLGKVNWNSVDLARERTRILSELGADVQKTKFIAEIYPELQKKINEDKYIIKDIAHRDLTNAMYRVTYDANGNPVMQPRSIKEVDIGKMESILNDFTYKNVPAMLKDRVESMYNQTFTTSPWVKRENGMLITNQATHSGLWRPKQRADGKGPEIGPDGEPVLESVLNDNTDITKDLLASTGNYQKAFEYFSNLYRTQFADDPSDDGNAGSYEKRVLDFASRTIETMNAPSVKTLSSVQEFIDPNSRVDAAQRKADEQADKTITQWTKEFMSGYPQAMANQIADLYGDKAQDVVVSTGAGPNRQGQGDKNWYLDVINKQPIQLRDLLKKNKDMFTETLDKERNVKVFSMKPEFKSQYTPFTGIAIKVQTGKKPITDEPIYGWVVMKGDPKSEESARSLATSVYNAVYKKETAYTPPAGSGNPANAPSSPQRKNLLKAEELRDDTIFTLGGKTYTVGQIKRIYASKNIALTNEQIATIVNNQPE